MPAPPPEPASPTFGFAIAGLVCGIVGILLGAAGLSLGIVATVKANRAARELAALKKEIRAAKAGGARCESGGLPRRASRKV